LPPGAEALSRAGVGEGDALLLTKPLGTGVILAAAGAGRARGEWLEAAYASMLASNRDAMQIAIDAGARAVTDVTGFGLAGHLRELLSKTNLGVRIDMNALPLLPGARELIANGVRSSFHSANSRARADIAVGDDVGSEAELLFDPQTSGGLLVAVGCDIADRTVETFRAAGHPDTGIIAEIFGRNSADPLMRVERDGLGHDAPDRKGLRSRGAAVLSSGDLEEVQ
jgi:selenide,water dikinase